MKKLTLSKKWFTEEEAEEYGTVDDQDDEVWIVTFPDDTDQAGETDFSGG